MKVFISDSFYVSSSDKVREDLIEAFSWWKQSPTREFLSPFFGKDSALISPKVGGRSYTLMHCHLVPLHDKKAFRQWMIEHRRGSRKRSDRVLIYAQRDDQYLLIDVVDDPGAHEIMRMVDQSGKSFMLKCAQEANAFLNGPPAIPPPVLMIDTAA